ncbi:hypothetical protein ELH50_15760 [Rhizobium ruizarguesonis]|uniref:DUF6953 family protein n=1 Tax=Rhizobium ruizarguesonis TaxID=2081791 RepID=UPI0010314BED|nr:hypothetical protein [Rhizobium ruizarguesonis]TBB12447.1 hypothetical protein ELH50_15760 [Rhizobium ruizarguesonis]
MEDVIAEEPPAPEKTTARQVAEWMVEQMGERSRLIQEVIVRKIKKEWGDDWVEKNQNGNLAIPRAVLKEFKALTDDTLVWERSSKSWRKRRPNDKARGVD